jgi:hypothetical protein
MAIFYTDKSRSFGRSPGVGSYRNIITLDATVAMTTTMLDNADDEVGLFWAPAGFVVTAVTISGSDMDSGTTLAFDVGDDADENRLVAASTVGQAGTVSNALAATGHLYQYTARTLIKAYVQAAATGAAAGTLRVSIDGFIDPDTAAVTALTATTTA